MKPKHIVSKYKPMLYFLFFASSFIFSCTQDSSNEEFRRNRWNWWNHNYNGGGSNDSTGGTSNQSPVINAGTDQTITLPVNTVTLKGTATDPDGTVTSYNWSKVSGPSGESIASPVNITTLVNNLVAGTYVFKFEATDNMGAVANDNVMVTVNPTLTTLPTNGGGSTTRNNIIFQSSFEGSNPFSGLTNNQSCCNYSVTASSSVAREGSQSFRAEVRKSDPAVSSGYRAELTGFPSSTGDMWYGWSMYFEKPASGSSWIGGGGGHVAQWHPGNGSGSASLAIWADAGKFDITTNPSGSGSVTHQSGSLKSIQVGKWYDIVFHVVWGSNGKVEVWMDGQLYFTKTGLNWAGGEYMKLGMNRWNMNNDWVVYYDNIRVARNASYNDVKPGN